MKHEHGIKHAVLMLLGCALAFGALLFLPSLGLSQNWSWVAGLLLMVALHWIFMRKMHHG